MACEEIRELISAELDGAVTADERERLEAHLEGCGECAKFREGLIRSRALLRDLEEVEPPPWLRGRVMESVREEKAKRKFSGLFPFSFPRTVPAGAVALILVAFLTAYLFREMEREKLVPPPSIQMKSKKEALKPAGPAPIAGEKKVESESEKRVLDEREEATETPGEAEEIATGKTAREQDVRRAPAETAPSRKRAFEYRAAPAKPLPTIRLTTEAASIDVAARELEKTVESLGGKVTERKKSERGVVMTVTLPGEKAGIFNERLSKMEGAAVEGKAPVGKTREILVTVEIRRRQP